MQLTEENFRWSQKLLRLPSTFRQAKLVGFPTAAALPHCSRQPAKRESQGTPSPKKRTEGKCLLIVTCGIGEIPQWELPVQLDQRLKQQPL